MKTASEKPILFSGPMVAAILDGRKTQTRRLANIPFYQGVNPEFTGIHPVQVGSSWYMEGSEKVSGFVKCPQPVGTRLWVREAHAIVPATAYRMSTDDGVNPIPHAISPDGHEWAVYRADWSRSEPRWRPSIHMPRWASRITLEVTDVRVERLQDISEADAIAEGVTCWICGGPVDGSSEEECGCFHSKSTAIQSFQVLWESINGPGSWERNEWVWAYSFRRVEG